MIFPILSLILLTNLHNIKSSNLNLPGCTILAAVCKSDPTCFDEDVFLEKCLLKNGLKTEADLYQSKLNDYRLLSTAIKDSIFQKFIDSQKESIYQKRLLNEKILQEVQVLSDKIKKREKARTELRHLFDLYQQESIRESKRFSLKKKENNLANQNPKVNKFSYSNVDNTKQTKLINRAYKLIQTLVNHIKEQESKSPEKEISPTHDISTFFSLHQVKQSSDEKGSNKVNPVSTEKNTSEFVNNLNLPLDSVVQSFTSQDREEKGTTVQDTTTDEVVVSKRANNRPEVKEDRGHLTITTSQSLNETSAANLGNYLQSYLWNIDAGKHRVFILSKFSKNLVEYNILISTAWFKFVDNSTTVALLLKTDPTLLDKIKNATGIDIIDVTSSNPYPDTIILKGATKREWNQLTVFTSIIGGCTIALFLIAIVFFILKRNSKLKPVEFKKQEAFQDYQELCRTQMSVVNSTDKDTEKDGNMRGNWNEDAFPYDMDITTGHVILSYMEDHLRNDNRLNKEWEALCSYKAEDVTTVHASDPKNSSKNRYRDVLPFDHSRVKLHEISNTFHSDYINASFITDINPRQPEYIATQGPLDNTIADFWQMVWEQGVAVIVNLTKLSDVGLPQCHRYWPENDSHVYHIYEVHLISEHIWCDDYLVRSLYLKNLQTSETRTVTQFHYLTWPDLSVPNSPKHLLEFRRKVNKCYRGHACPIIVHCNNGVGRTGTYILLDMVLNKMIKGAKEMDIAASLEHIRDQRPDMVKTKGQFEFALTAVAEEVTTILSSVPK